MGPQHFENEFLIIDLTDEPGCILKMEVKATPKTVAEAHRKALQSVRKEVTLPGFRKGKVPEQLLYTHFAKAIDQEWRDNTLNLAFQKALELTGKNPIRASADKIQSKLKSFKGHNEPAEAFFQFESHPSVPSFDMADLNLDLPEEKPVTDEDINDVIESARHSMATWEEVTDRGAERGDFIRLDMTQMGETDLPVFTDRRLIIKEKKMAPWLMDLVIGMRPGESREGTSVPDQSLDENILEKELKVLFKPIAYRITLKAIEKAVTPEVDDEFAKKLGATDVTHMRETIGKQLKAQRHAQRHTALIEKLEEALFDKHSFDMPASLVHKDAGSFEKSKQQTLRTQGNLTDSEVQQHKALIRELSEKESRKRLALYYLLNDFNTKHNVHVSREDLNAKMNQLLSHIPEEMIPQVVKNLNEDFYAAILSETVIEKGLEYIASKLLAA